MTHDQFIALLDASRGYLYLGVCEPFRAGEPFRLYLRRGSRSYLAGVDEHGELTGRPSTHWKVLLAEAEDLEAVRRRREYFLFHLDAWKSIDPEHRTFRLQRRRPAEKGVCL